uniref:Uncharacterized protein n=1 Tax=Zea mays TaxID=4577 RepID=A0A804N0U7_MAIZE
MPPPDVSSLAQSRAPAFPSPSPYLPRAAAIASSPPLYPPPPPLQISSSSPSLPPSPSLRPPQIVETTGTVETTGARSDGGDHANKLVAASSARAPSSQEVNRLR